MKERIVHQFLICKFLSIIKGSQLYDDRRIPKLDIHLDTNFSL